MSSFYIFILPFLTLFKESFIRNKRNSFNLPRTRSYGEKKISTLIIQILHRHAENLPLLTVWNLGIHFSNYLGIFENLFEHLISH